MQGCESSRSPFEVFCFHLYQQIGLDARKRVEYAKFAQVNVQDNVPPQNVDAFCRRSLTMSH